MQKVVPETDTLFVRVASNGKRICVIKSVDGTTITSFCVHECEGSSRVGSRPRRFVITGHSSGAVQGRRRKSGILGYLLAEFDDTTRVNLHWHPR